jgi:hypothetical protein
MFNEFKEGTLCQIVRAKEFMDKLQSTGQNLGSVFNSRIGYMHANNYFCYKAKVSGFKCKMC